MRSWVAPWCAGVLSLAASASTLAAQASAELRPAPRLAVVVSGNVGRAPARAFGGIVARDVRAASLEYQHALFGSGRGGVAWTPTVHPALGMSGVPTADALIFYECGSGPASRTTPCVAQWSDRRTATAVALEPFALRVWRRLGRVELAVRPGIGAALFPRAIPIPEGRRLNALLRLDAEVAAPLGARDRLVVRYGWWHLSNAGSAPLNPGVDVLQLQVGVSRSLGRR
ncbi:MAG: acyloxyacyl hydrolase [Gemmatimonadaceae bacterium]|jgi:hypothetical protein|nr:acyloxyacyl hydrolase [Gemmatimonadaceae bacterium]